MAHNQLDHLAKAASGLMPARQLDKAELREVVQTALSGLNERQRMAVLLCKFEEMSYTDIAETMQMSPQAVKSLLAQCTRQLARRAPAVPRHGERPGETSKGLEDRG